MIVSRLFEALPGGSRVLALRSAYWNRSWVHRTGRLMIYTGFTYLAVFLLLLALEDRLLYRASRKAEAWYEPPASCSYEDVILICNDGTSVHGWWFAPSGWEPAQGAVLFCHGNGGNLSWRGQSMQQWVEELHTAVLLIDYPGYGQSGGDPSEAGCYAAGDAAFAWLRDDQHIPPEQILLYGGSLGGAVAIDLAARHPYRALVLLDTFTSFPDMAQKTFPWLPGRWFVRNRFDSLMKIAMCPGRVFIAHGTEDQLVPYHHGERLFEAAQEPKRFLPLPGFRHRDTPPRSFFPALRTFLQDVESRSTAD